ALSMGYVFPNRSVRLWRRPRECQCNHTGRTKFAGSSNGSVAIDMALRSRVGASVVWRSGDVPGLGTSVAERGLGDVLPSTLFRTRPRRGGISTLAGNDGRSLFRREPLPKTGARVGAKAKLRRNGQ